MNKKLRKLIVPVCAVLVFSACSTPKNIAYFTDVNDGATIALAESKGITLRPSDKLSIVVNTKSAELNNVLNLPAITHVIGSSEALSLNQSQGMSGYTIAPDGNIDFPLIGKVKAAGLTRTELATKLKQILEEKDAAKDAVVTVEFLNIGFSVLGEVNSPGFHAFINDKTTLLQGLSRAGDLSLYGNRNNVKVIRMQDGQQKVYEIDLQNTEAVMKSPAYILQQNDVIYVEPNNYRKRQATANASEVTKASFWLSAISAIATLAVLIFK
jgi:polysaccharide export outer membrane protein